MADGHYVTLGSGERVWRKGPAPGDAPKRKRLGREKGGEQAGLARPTLSEAERAERFQFQRDRLEVRRRELEALEELAGPRLIADGDPPVEHERAIPLDARTAAGLELARIERPNGTSTLRAHARTYDGMRGGRPKFYALIATWFRRPSGAALRSKGVAVEGPELRPIAQALLALADEYDAALASGSEPWAVPGSSWQPRANAPIAAMAQVGTSGANVSDDCDECGGELPNGHLDGCRRADETEPSRAAVHASSVRPPAGGRPTVIVDCHSEGTAKTVAANMAREGRAAVVDGDRVRVGPFADAAAAESLAARLTRSSLVSRVEWVASGP